VVSSQKRKSQFMKGKGLLSGIHTIARKSVDFTKKHPVVVAGGTGIGVGISRSEAPRRKAQDRIMREYLGAPGAKYSSCELLETFTERKMALEAKVAFEKVALKEDFPSFDQSTSSGAGTALGSGVIREGVAAIRRLLGMSSQAIANKVVAEPQRKKIVKEVLNNDTVIRSAEQENPGQALQAYNTMKRFAPTLSTDPNVVTSFLRNSALTGGPMDFQTIKGLADAEAAVQRAKNEGAWLKGGF